MSIKKYQDVQEIFFEIIDRYKIEKGYSGLARFLGVEYHALMKWKVRNKIADYSPFLDKCPGISLACLKTMEGELFPFAPASVDYQKMADKAAGNMVCEAETEYKEDGVMILKGVTPIERLIIEDIRRVPREHMADLVDYLRRQAAARQQHT